MSWRIWPGNNGARAAARELPAHIKALLAPYFPGLDLDAVRVLEGIPWYVAMDADAYTDRHLIYFKPGKYDTRTPQGIALIGHEITHCRQYRSYGTWRFRAAYSSCWARKLFEHRSWERAYFLNPFEVEARTMEERIYNDIINSLRSRNDYESVFR